MFHSPTSVLGRAVMERATLWLNHVVAAEPAAVQRLRPHAGRTLRVEAAGWPSLLPPWPPSVFRVTPAGLFEWLGDTPPASAVPLMTDDELVVSIDLSNPAQALVKAVGGLRPAVSVRGDAAFAADLSWLADHLRWDVEDDLARVIGPMPARELSRIASIVSSGLRSVVRP